MMTSAIIRKNTAASIKHRRATRTKANFSNFSSFDFFNSDSYVVVDGADALDVTTLL